MSPPFEDITVTRFDASPSDQDSEFPGLFHFKFHYSRSAPDVWVQIAEQEVAPNGRVSFVIQRRAAAYSGFISVRCSPSEAQRIKDALNRDIMPSVNQRYRQFSEARQARAAAAEKQRQGILSDLEQVIRNQT